MTREEKKEVGQQMKRDIMRGLSDCYRKGSGQYNVVKKMLSEISKGIWGSGTSKWSKLLKINNNRTAWRIAMPIRRIGTYFYEKVL